MDIPFKAHARPELLANGDIIALYAGDNEPRYTATVLCVIRDGAESTVVTTDGRYTVPSDSAVWVAAWAPIATLIPETPRRPAYTRAQRHASRFAPMGVS